MDEVEAAALGGQFEALGPAVDGLGLEGLAVEGGLPAFVGPVGDAQDAARVTGGDLAVGLDGSGGDGDRGLALLAGEDDGARQPGFDAPQGGAVLLVATAEAGGGVEDAADLLGPAGAEHHEADGEGAELAGLVGAGAGDEVGDDLVEAGVAAGAGGDLRVADAAAGAADEAVGDGGGRVQVEDQGAGLVVVAARVRDEGRDLYGVAALQRAVGPGDQPGGGGDQRSHGGGQGDEGGQRLAPAEAAGGDAFPGPVGAERGGREEGEPVDEGGGSGPGGAVEDDGQEQSGQGCGPGGADGEGAVAAQQGGQGGEDDADEHRSGAGAGAAGADGEQADGVGGAGPVGQAGLVQEAAGVREQAQ